MKPTIHGFLIENELWEQTLKEVLKSIENAIEEHGHARIGLAGGSTPKRLYELLAKQNLPWQKITWILLDERYVPDDDEESNIRMVRNILFIPTKVPHENVICFDTTLQPEVSAEEMSKKIAELKKIREPLFDLLILGAGSDGHIASLFENDGEIFTPKIAYVSSAPESYETKTRLTLSLLTLTKTVKAILILKGKEKKPVVHALEGGEHPKMTALKFLSEKTELEVFVYFEE